MVQASGKLVLVDKLLPKLKAGGHKVLIFSQMIRVLDILEDYLIQMRFTYERIDGRIRGELRQEAIDRYSKPDSDRFAFLLCTRAGGLGINLTAADTVIIYDSDWNPQNDLQAQARCHRIGQKNSVKIYRLITRNTYEREMFDKASLKLGLDKAILQSMRNEDKFNPAQNSNLQLSKKEIEDLLKKGAYGAIMEDDNAGDKFCEEDIDKILQQRSTVIQIEGGEKGSTFSKASFQTAETNDISIDDPEFWQKWAKKADIDIEEKLNPKDERIIYEPRRRTQTRRYGGPDDLLEESEYSSSDTDENDPNKEKDGKGKRGKRSKRNKGANGDGNENDGDYNGNDDDDSNVWSRDECYKVEKNLLIYGWSRWAKILRHCEFSSKKKCGVQSEQDVENLSRTIIAYTLKNYQGDETIKQFILELIDPSKSNFDDLKSHSGLAAPVGRGKKPRPKNSDAKADKDKAETADVDKEKEDKEQDSEAPVSNVNDLEWAKNAEDLLGDENYKKHLIRQANRILLRLRMLFYIKHEIIGDEAAAKIDEEDVAIESAESSQAPLPDILLPEVLADLPADWWDKTCDTSMFIGVYKHGYEKYMLMRLDPKLCFLQLCGPPDAQDLLAEQQQLEDVNDENVEVADVDTENTETSSVKKPQAKSKSKNKDGESTGYKKFPTVSELNNRLRRMITSVQKFKKQEQLMSKRNAERQEKRLSKLASTQEKAAMRQIEKQSKWSRREEQNFYRAISTFGVDCVDKANNVYAWERFKEIAQLDKKLDETLTDYYNSFYYMCKKVCNKLAEDEPLPMNEVQVEVISEERASRCLQRIDLLNKVRHDVLKHDKFDEWISERCMASSDLPDWWIPGKHDRELIVAAARYGITRTEFYFTSDPEFSFKEYLGKYMKHIEDLMDEDNEAALAADGESAVRNVDPIQYYFQNQAKIQISFKEVLSKEIIVRKAKEEDKVVKEEKTESEKKDSKPTSPKESPKKVEVDDENKEKQPAEEEKKEEKEEAEKDGMDVETTTTESPSKEKRKSTESTKDEEEKEKEEKDEKDELMIVDETINESKTEKLEVVEEENDEKAKEVDDKKENEEEQEEKKEEQEEVKVKEEAVEETTKSAEEKEPADSEKAEDKEIKPESDENEAKECDKKEEEEKETPPVEKVESETKVASPKSVEQVETEPANQKPAETEQLKEEKIEADPVVQPEIKPTQPLTLSYFAGNTVPMIMWPKDRVISNRLENIIQLFESNGEWPQRTLFMYTPAPNMPGTPLGSNPFSISNLVGSSLNPQALLLAEQRKLMMSPMLGDNNSMDGMNETDMYDYDNSNTDMNDDYYKSDSKYQKPKRGRPPKLDLPQMASSLGVSAASATAMAADPANKIRNLLGGSSVSSPSNNGREGRHRSNMSLAEDQDMGSDYDTPSPTRLKSGKKGGDENNKSGFLEPGEIFRPKSTRGITKGQPLEDSFDEGSFSKANLNKRGRKSSIKEPIGSSSNQNSMDLEAALSGAANSADASAAAAIQQLAALFMTPGQDPDERIPMINVEDGTRLVGNKAPKRGDLARWLMTHPNYLPDQSELISMTLKNQAALNNPSSSSSSSSNERNMRRMSKSLKQDYMETSSIDEEPPSPPPKSKQEQFGNQKQQLNNNNNNNQNKNQQSSKPPQQQAAATTSSSFDPNAPLVLFNKVTNKRLNSQKVPMWKALASFLEKNEQVYIDPTCNELVRAKFGRNNLPEIVKSRMINVNKANPSNKPNNNNNQSQQQQQTRSNSNSSTISHSPPPQSSKSSSNNNNQSRNKPSKPNNSQQQQQQQQQQQGLFNPFSPDSAAAAQLQGLTDLLSAAGQVDLNNPLAGFMAAALAGQGGAGGLPFGGLASGAPNPFLMAPFGGMPGMPGANPLANPLLADLFKNMPPGFDMNSFDELTAQLAAAQAQALQQPDSPSAKSMNESSSKQSNESKQSSSNNNSSSNKNKERERERNRDQSEHRDNRELRDKRAEADNNKSQKKPAPSSNSSNRDKESSESKNSNNNNNNSQKSSSSSNKQPSSNSIDSKLNKGQSSSSSSKKPNESSSSSSSASRNANSSKDNNKNMDLAAAMQHMDPNAAALAASMMDQEKMLQEMMNLSQFASAFPNNPFYGLSGLPGFPAPSMPSLSSSLLGNSSKNNRGRSQSPSQNANGRDRSVSPTSSVASNISQQQAPLDFNMFMNNLMNYQLMGGANGAGSFTAPLPPPPLGLPGLPGDLSKLPVELLTALAQSGGVGGMGGLDPSMFSALAQLNSLSNNVSNEEVASSKESRNQASKNHQSNKSSSSSNKPSSGSSSHHHNSSSSKSSSSNGSSNMKSSSSSSSSSSKIPPKPSSNNQMKKPSGDQGLDLTMKKPSSFSSSSSSKPSSKPSSDKLRPPAK
jgi:superfamily II DNA/RNA helicase